ncbi:methionyl-tRNA formyltransferase [Marisediminicola senii]|uniref:methionyl-tRNA formyltransferase n=1 Tax=Marisediminicola senii TaxID=2711233 RepID=UPI0013EDA1C0|nr:methionyl-tRNA formyltransferase [Marisediminicola senii]
MRIVFAGSPAAAVPSLRALAQSPHEIVGVVTRQASPQGRRRILTPTAVEVEAERLGLSVIATNRLDADATTAITALGADLGVIVAYGALVREPLLSAPRLGWINLHFSLLPRWRGAAPVQRAIMAGDEITGATVFQLVPELDAGDVFGMVTQPVGAHETAGHLLASLSDGGAELLSRVVDSIARGDARAEPQRGDVTLAPKLTLADGALDWTMPGGAVYDVIRGVTPEPGAFTTVDGARLKVLDASVARDVARAEPGELVFHDRRLLVGTASDPIELVTVQPAGKKPMAAPDWWRGRPAGAGTIAG